MKILGIAVVPPGSGGFLPDDVRDAPHAQSRTRRDPSPSPLVAIALTVSSSTCGPRSFGSYRITTLAVCPGGIRPDAGVGLKKDVRDTVKSTAVSLLTFLTLSRWSPASWHATDPKSSAGGSNVQRTRDRARAVIGSISL